jgi:hypothetical protein
VKLSSENYWKNFIEFFTQYHNLKSRFKIYIYKYPSYKHVTFNAAILKNMLTSEDNGRPELNEYLFNGGKTIFVGHSMGTIVIRSAFEEHDLSSDYAEKIILLDGVHHGSPAAIPNWNLPININSTLSINLNSSPRDLFTLGANDIQWDNYDSIFTSESISKFNKCKSGMKYCTVFEDITNLSVKHNYWSLNQLDIKNITSNNQIGPSIPECDIPPCLSAKIEGFFYGTGPTKENHFTDNKKTIRLNDTFNFDIFFREKIGSIKNENITLPVLKKHNEYDYIVGEYKVHDVIVDLGKEYAILPVVPNPWLTFLNLKHQTKDKYYKNKLILFGAINANGNNEENHNNKIDDDLMGLPEDVVQYLGGITENTYGYLNDGPVPINSQLLDLKYSFDELAQLSISNQVTMYFLWKDKGFKDGTSTIKMFRPGENGYEGDGYATHMLFMDYHHDRMKSGAYSDEGSDSLLEYNSPRETGFKYDYRKPYIISALRTAGINFRPDEQDLVGNELRLEPLFLAIASQIVPADLLLSLLNKKIFPDVYQNNPYINAIASLYERGMIHGHPNGMFEPYNDIKRVEAAKIIVEAAEAAGIKMQPMTTQQLSEQFGDMTNASGWSIIDPEIWYAIYIGKLYNHGAINGYPDGTKGYSPGPFLPEKKVSRAEMLKMVILSFFPPVPLPAPIPTTGPGTVLEPTTSISPWIGNTKCLKKGYWFCEYTDKAEGIGIKPLHNDSQFIAINPQGLTDIVDRNYQEVPASRQETVKAVYDAFMLYRAATK